MEVRVCFLIAFILFCGVNATNPECDILEKLFTGTEGEYWTIPFNFTQTDNCCDWHGISCHEDNTTVFGIELVSNNLTGPLPAVLGNLADVQYIHLSGNRLYGEVPTSFENLQSIFSLSLAGNMLTGTLDVFTEMTTLRSRWLDKNHFSGPIPRSISDLTEIEFLVLSQNDLTGEIPETIGDLTMLTYLDLSSNQLETHLPSSLGTGPRQLQTLKLEDMKVLGSIPESWQDMTSIYMLSFRNASLSGDLKNFLPSGPIEHLSSLDVSFNNFEGELPSLKSWEDLGSLDISHNKFTGELADIQLGNKLYAFHFASNRYLTYVPTFLDDVSICVGSSNMFSCYDENYDYDATYHCHVDCTPGICVLNETAPDDLGFTCTCDAGYTGVRCEINIDECNTTAADCGPGLCVDGINSYTCDCTDSGAIGKYCQYPDWCVSSPCASDKECAFTEDGYVCVEASSLPRSLAIDYMTPSLILPVESALMNITVYGGGFTEFTEVLLWDEDMENSLSAVEIWVYDFISDQYGTYYNNLVFALPYNLSDIWTFPSYQIVTFENIFDDSALSGTAICPGDCNPDDTLFFSEACPEEEWYGVGDTCQPCPEGLECPGGNRAWPLPGYWKDPEDEASLVVYECNAPAETRCLGGRESLCAAEYTGITCAECQDSYYADNMGLCRTCEATEEDVAELILAGIIGAGVLLVFMLGTITMSNKNLFRLVAVFVMIQQMLTSVSGASALYSIEWQQFFRVLDGFVFSFSFIRPECITGKVPYWMYFIGSMSVAIIVLGLSVVAAIIRQYRSTKRINTRLSVCDWNKYTAQVEKPRIRLTSMLVADTLYMHITTLCIGMLACIERDGELQLAIEPSSLCFEGMTLFTQILAICILCSFSIALPMWFFYKLFFGYRTKQLDPKKTRSQFYYHFGFLYRNLERRPTTFWFRLVHYPVSFILAVQSVVLHTDPRWNLAVSFAVFGIELVIVLCVWPFVTFMKNGQTILVNLGQLIFLSFSLLFSVESNATDEGIGLILLSICGLLFFVACPLCFKQFLKSRTPKAKPRQMSSVSLEEDYTSKNGDVELLSDEFTSSAAAADDLSSWKPSNEQKHEEPIDLVWRGAASSVAQHDLASEGIDVNVDASWKATEVDDEAKNRKAEQKNRHRLSSVEKSPARKTRKRQSQSLLSVDGNDSSQSQCR